YPGLRPGGVWQLSFDPRSPTTLYAVAGGEVFEITFVPSSLLNQIINTARQGTAGKRLYIRGAINQDPSTKKNNVELFSQENWQRADYSLVLPAAIDKPTAWFVRELKKLPKAFAMVHSKVVLIDPFGAHPILVTGSHNLGPKASGTNDENLLIIRDAPGLAP